MNEKSKEQWLVLWKWIQEFKKEYKLTNLEFLRVFHFCREDNPYFLSYLDYISENGKDRCPSTREGTMGRGLRDHIKCCMSSKPDFSVLTIPRSWVEKMRDEYDENKQLYFHAGLNSIWNVEDAAKIRIAVIGNTVDETFMRTHFTTIPATTIIEFDHYMYL